MRITERQLRRIVREVIAEEQINEGLKDNTIIKTAVAVLAAVGMYASITGGHEDILKAQKVADTTPGIEKVINHKALSDLQGYNPGVEMTTILNQ